VALIESNPIGLLPPYQGAPTTNQLDYMVYTEYGGDAQKQVFSPGSPKAGSLKYPAAQALIGIK
jgi:hypothetical protein